jgi:hypothetical protein
MINATTTLRRITQAFCLVALTLGLVGLSSPAQAQNEVQVSINDQAANVGETVEVDIRVENLDNADDFRSLGIDNVSIDPQSNASFVEYEIAGTILGQADDADYFVQTEQDGRLAVAGGSDLPPINDFAEGGSGTLVTARIEVTGAGEASVDLENLQFNSTDPPATAGDTSFDVVAGDDVFSIPDRSATSGQTIVVPVRTTNLTSDLTSFAIDISYDESVLTFEGQLVSNDGTSAVSADLDQTTSGTPGSGLLRLGGSASADDPVAVDGSRPLTFMEFTVDASARSDLDFVDGEVRVNGEDFEGSTKDGSIDARNAGPVISGFPDNQTIDEDGSTGALSFTIEDVDNTPSELKPLSVSSSNTDLVPESNIDVTFPANSSDEATIEVEPAPNQNDDSQGPATISLTVDDPSGASDSDSFELTVTPVRDDPEANDDFYSVPDGKNDTLNVVATNGVLVNDAHSDSSSGFSIQGVNSQPIQEADNGQVDINANGSFRYVPDEDFFGTDSFTYEVTDGDRTDQATVRIEVAEDPVARADTFETTKDVVLDIPNSVQNILHTSQLTASQSTVNGGLGGGSSSGTGNANLVVFATEDGFVLDYEITLSGLDFSTFASGFDGTDATGDNVVGFHLHNAARGETGGVVFGIVGSVTDGAPFDPASTDDSDRQITVDNENNRIQISGTWSPGEGAQDPGEFVNAIANAEEGDDVPLYLNLHTEANRGGEIRGQVIRGAGPSDVGGVLANDDDASFVDDRVEDDMLAASVVDDVSNGSLTLNPNGTLRYVPDSGFTGEDSFTYEADDGDQATDQATVTINVEPVNNPPFFTTTAPEDPADAFAGQTFEQQFEADPGDEDDSVTYSLEGSVPNASIDSETGLFTFTPSEDQVAQTFTFEVRAEDEGGLRAAQSFDVEVREVLLGDVTGNGEVSALDATRVLQADVGQSPPRPLSDRDSTAADVTADGSIAPLDASAILRFVVGDIDSFSEVQNGGGSSEALATTGSANLTWGEPSTEKSRSILPVRLENSGAKVYSISITLRGDLSNVATGQITTALPDGWQSVKAERAGDAVEIVMAGATPLTESQEVVRLPLQSDDVGELGISGTASLNEGEAAQIEGLGDIDTPDRFSFLGNYPNPVAQSTSITFNLPEDASVKVSVYDVLGREVRSVTREMAAGAERTVRLQADGLSSGMYLLRVEASSGDQKWTDSGRMVVSK